MTDMDWKWHICRNADVPRVGLVCGGPSAQKFRVHVELFHKMYVNFMFMIDIIALLESEVLMDSLLH